MDNVVTARPPQTLYVTVRRDELRQLREEREQLLREVAHLQERLQQIQAMQDCVPAPVLRTLHN
ncbi:MULTISPECIES: DUF6026 family protein [Pseudomonas]|uniref:Uncharacterized protein n=1 Tax=Pseudomonas baetica TaxID=674054 RepID=A0ABX4PXW9_9PSED|nr:MULTISPECIES: DUF6026 family protein [Pseudomonas]MDR9864171.1 DUF6026 family protein [Pseudomonas baetica]PKA68887.1 hypothetical protein ATI02_1691 [Pseudomonas baetica]PTC19427.1 hypothetical protein C0J26_13620 [Pseudomonas baetica]